MGTRQVPFHYQFIPLDILRMLAEQHDVTFESLDPLHRHYQISDKLAAVGAYLKREVLWPATGPASRRS